MFANKKNLYFIDKHTCQSHIIQAIYIQALYFHIHMTTLSYRYLLIDVCQCTYLGKYSRSHNKGSRMFLFSRIFWYVMTDCMCLSANQFWVVENSREFASCGVLFILLHLLIVLSSVVNICFWLGCPEKCRWSLLECKSMHVKVIVYVSPCVCMSFVSALLQNH